MRASTFAWSLFTATSLAVGLARAATVTCSDAYGACSVNYGAHGYSINCECNNGDPASGDGGADFAVTEPEAQATCAGSLGSCEAGGAGNGGASSDSGGDSPSGDSGTGGAEGESDAGSDAGTDDPVGDGDDGADSDGGDSADGADSADTGSPGGCSLSARPSATQRSVSTLWFVLASLGALVLLRRASTSRTR